VAGRLPERRNALLIDSRLRTPAGKRRLRRARLWRLGRRANSARSNSSGPCGRPENVPAAAANRRSATCWEVAIGWICREHPSARVRPLVRFAGLRTTHNGEVAGSNPAGAITVAERPSAGCARRPVGSGRRAGLQRAASRSGPPSSSYVTKPSRAAAGICVSGVMLCLRSLVAAHVEGRDGD
jgi:hypothetical protein